MDVFINRVEDFINTFVATIASNIETMSVFQMTGAIIWLAMVFSFFSWILYLVVSK